MQQDDNRLTRTTHFWSDFASDAECELGLDGDTLEAMLARLTRTGLYQEIIGAYYDYTGGRAYLTSRFAEFLRALGMSEPRAGHSSTFGTDFYGFTRSPSAT